MTIANLGLAVDSSSVATATPELQKMTAASAQAEAAAERLGAASRSSAAGTATATAATKMHTVALQAQAAASRMVANDTRMLGFQINDIAVSLASGMNPAMVAMQQGSQIAQMGLRNVGVAALSMARSFAPVLAVVGALTIGVAALATEFNRNEKQQVSWSDVVVAGWQLVSERFMTFFQPVLDTLGGWWDLIAPNIAAGINNLIGAFDLAFKDIKTIWELLPAALGEVAIGTANAVIMAMQDMINGAIGLLNSFIAGANGLLPEGMKLGELGKVALGQFENPYAGAGDSFNAGMAQNRAEVMGTDYLGIWGDRARQVAAAGGMDDDDKKTKKAAAGIRSITDEFEKLQGKVMGVRDVVTGVFGDMGSVIAESFRKGGNVAMNVLQGILDKVGNVGESLMNAGLNGLLNAGLGALTGALTNSMPGMSYGPNVFSDPWGGMRANGGPVDAGKAYIVGEKRPELFVPRTSGSIVPQVPGGGVTMNFNISGSKQDAAAIAQTVRIEAWKMYRQMQINPDRAPS